MSASRRFIVLAAALIALGFAVGGGSFALAADQDPPDSASKVLDILMDSKKIQQEQKEHAADKSKSAAADSDTRKAADTSSDKSSSSAAASAGANKSADTSKHPADSVTRKPTTPILSIDPAHEDDEVADAAKTHTDSDTSDAKTPGASGSHAAGESPSHATAKKPAMSSGHAADAHTPAGGAAKPDVAGTKTYTIKEGDTFTSIAQNLYHDANRWTAIAQANPLIDPAHLKVGQVIRLPNLAEFEKQREQQLEAIKKAVSEHNGSGPAAGKAESHIVVVQPGDSLSHIARRVYGKPGLWKVIFEANKQQLSSPDKLQVGMKLVIPPKPKE